MVSELFHFFSYSGKIKVKVIGNVAYDQYCIISRLISLARPTLCTGAIEAKLRSLRVEFGRKMRELNKPSGSQGDRNRPWHFINSLMFLRDCITPRCTTSNLNLSLSTSATSVTIASRHDAQPASSTCRRQLQLPVWRLHHATMHNQQPKPVVVNFSYQCDDCMTMTWLF